MGTWALLAAHTPDQIPLPTPLPGLVVPDLWHLNQVGNLHDLYIDKIYHVYIIFIHL